MEPEDGEMNTKTIRRLTTISGFMERLERNEDELTDIYRAYQTWDKNKKKL